MRSTVAPVLLYYYYIQPIGHNHTGNKPVVVGAVVQ